jgi:hypothetical protein
LAHGLRAIRYLRQNFAFLPAAVAFYIGRRGRGLMSLVRASLPVWLGVVLCGCQPPVDRETIPAGLQIEQTADVASGSFADERHALRFRSEASEYTFDIEIELDGLTLTAMLDEDGNFVHDGFVHGGEDRPLTDDDREALAALSAALDGLGPDVSRAVARLDGFASVWSEFPLDKPLRGEVPASLRSYDSLCAELDTYVAATHDDAHYQRWDDASTTDYVWVGMNGPGPCEGGTYFASLGGAWSCYEPDHNPAVEHAIGDCFGRCGTGCGRGRQFTRDCLDHDQCTRVGHSLTSSSCTDEFSRAIDDWISAPDCSTSEPEPVDLPNLRQIACNTVGGPSPDPIAGLGLLLLTLLVRRPTTRGATARSRTDARS